MKTPKKVDSIVVGAGITGLKIFNKLIASGETAMLIEKSNHIGGSLTQHSLDTKALSLNAVVWSTEEGEKTFETVTPGKKGLIPFMGFGDKKVPTLDIANTFLKPETNPRDADFLVSAFDLENTLDNSKALTHTQITKIFRNHTINHDDNPRFSALFNHCELNGKETLEFKRIFWTAPIQDFCDVLPKDEFPELKQKVKKAKSFDGLSIQFELEPKNNLTSETKTKTKTKTKTFLENIKALENKKIIILGEDDHPWMGALVYTKTNAKSPSLTFTTFYDWSLSQDHDFIRKHLKSLKRQVRKLLPELYSEEHINTFSDDKITFHTNVASNLKLNNKNGSVKGLENFTFLNSHKDFYPDPLELKLNFVENLSIERTSLELDETQQSTAV